MRAKPAKIVAGLDPEDTNALLQLLGEAAVKRVGTYGGVGVNIDACRYPCHLTYLTYLTCPSFHPLRQN